MAKNWLRGLRRRSPATVRMAVEALETRLTPTAKVTDPALLVPEVEPNDTFAGAQVLPALPDKRLEATPVESWLTVTGSVRDNLDFDVYKFTKTDKPFGLAVDLSSDPSLPLILELVAANQNSILANVAFSGGALTSLSLPFSFGTGNAQANNAGLYADLSPGTYYLRVHVTQGSGDYTMRVLSDSVYAAAVPAFSSKPDAPAQFYLDFDGHSSTTDYWAQNTPEARNGYSFPAFNIRGDGHVGDPNTFSPGERLFIANTWRSVAEDFSAFNLNVTTVEPQALKAPGPGQTVANAQGVALRNVVTNKRDQLWAKNAAGYAPLNAFTNTFANGPALNFPNTDLSNLPPPGANFALRRNVEVLAGVGQLISHEGGHALGLQHQFLTAADGTTLPAITYSGESKLRGPTERLATWVTGVAAALSPAIPPKQQNDMDVLAANGFGYRADDVGNTQAAAVALTATGNTYTRGGVIEKSDDVDFYSFVAAGKTTIDVAPIGYELDPNLNVQFELFDANGVSVARGIKPIVTANQKQMPSQAATLTLDNLANGTYFLKVSSTGRRGTGKPNQFIENFGQYTINVDTTLAAVNQPPAVTLPGGALSYTGKNPALLLDAGATVTDPDSPDFNGGNLTVSFTAGGSADDKITLQTDNVLDVGNGAVRVNGDLVGTVAGGDGVTPLVVTFTTDAATPAAAQQILRRVAFSNDADVPAAPARTVQVTAKDRQGATSTAVTKTVTVIAPARPQMKVEENAGLTVPPDGPKLFSGADLKVTSPAANAVVTYTISRAPRDGTLLLITSGGAADQPDSLPFALGRGDTFTQADIDGGRLAYRLTPGSPANDDEFFFTAADGAGGSIPETRVNLRVTRGAPPAPGGGGPPAARGLFAVFSSFSGPNLSVLVGAKASDVTLGHSLLNYTGSSGPRDVVYEIVSGPRHGGLSLPTTFTQKDVDHNLVTYHVPSVRDLPPDATGDEIQFVVRDAVTGGMTDTITLTISYINPNAAPQISDADGRFDLNPVPVLGPRVVVTFVRDLLRGGVSDPDALEGGAVKTGLAVVAADNANGTWEFSTDRGATWQAFGDVSETSALLLDGSSPDTAVRFLPNAGFAGLAEFRFHAWDETFGASGQRNDVANDEANEFSTATARAVQTVPAAEHDPSFTAGADVTVNENAGLVVVPNWATNLKDDGLGLGLGFDVVGDDEPDPQALVFVVGPEVTPDGTLRFEVAPDSSGTAEFSIHAVSGLREGAGHILTITVRSVNNAPTLTVGPDVTVNAGAGPIRLSGWATGLSAGPANEASQKLSVNITTDKPSLFSVAPTLNLTNGDLTFTPAAAGSGTATVSINLIDDGGTDNGGQNATTRVFHLTLASPAAGISQSADPNAAWLNQSYRDLLGRAADAGGLAFWSNTFAKGASRTQVVRGLQGSPEYTTHEAAQLYRTYLRREADAGGLAGLANLLAGGATLDQARAVLVSSAEYFQTRGGGGNAGFLSAVYDDVLHRAADAGGAAAWGGLLAAGASRGRVALTILGGAEAEAAKVRDAYQTLLGRAADDNGLNAYAGALRAGLREDVFLSTVLASEEYFARVK